MNTYRVVLDVYNSRQPKFKSMRVALWLKGWSPTDAMKSVSLRSVYVSSDLQTVNTTGGVGYGGSSYSEWECVSVRKVPNTRDNVVIAVAA